MKNVDTEELGISQLQGTLTERPKDGRISASAGTGAVW
jgi:hypothetical protein